MNLITILEEDKIKIQRNNWFIFLNIQKYFVEKHFGWLNLVISEKNKALLGRGEVILDGKKYHIILSFSPFNAYRYDRIYIDDKSILYNDKIHLYRDMSLCLYHPTIDIPLFQTIPLYRIIPWISEWIVFYNQWKKYGVWLSNEISHLQ